MKKQFGGISAISRKRLSLILKTYNEGFTVPEAAHILSMSLTQTKSLLSTWAKYGYIEFGEGSIFQSPCNQLRP
jgi:hypothetical protein